MEEQSKEVVYVTLEGGDDKLENFQATIAKEQKRLERAKIVQAMVENGTFHKLFSMEARREEIANATSFLVDPMRKPRMTDLLTFHAYLETYFMQLPAEIAHAEANIAELERHIEKM